MTKWFLRYEVSDGRRWYQSFFNGKKANVREYSDTIYWNVKRKKEILVSGEEVTISEAANEAKKYLIYGDGLLSDNN